MLNQQPITFNDYYDRPPDLFLIVPGRYAAWWSVILVVLGAGASIIHSFGSVPAFVLIGYYSLFPIAIGVHAVLIGSKPHRFLGKFHQPKSLVNTYPKSTITRSKLKPQVGSMKVGIPKRESFRVEDLTDLVAPVSFEIDGTSVGAFLLENGNNHRVVFCFEARGFAPTLSDRELNLIAEQLEDGLKSWTGFETLTFQQSSFAECNQEIERLKKFNRNETCEFLGYWQKRRVQQMTTDGLHNPKKLLCYLTYTFGLSHDEKPQTGGERLQRLMDRLSSRLDEYRILGKQKQPISSRLESMLLESLEQGFKRYIHFLDSIGIGATPLTWNQAWQGLWNRANDGPAPDPPLLIRLDSTGLDWVWNSPSKLSSLSILFHHGVPVLNNAFVELPNKKNKYVGVCVLDQRPAKSWAPDDRRGQLMYAIAALNSAKTRDTEIIVQISGADQDHLLTQAQRKTAQVTIALNTTSDKRKRDLGAEYNSEKSESAERDLRRGTVLLKVAWVALVYRPTLADLQHGIGDLLGNSAFKGGVISWERGYGDEIWAESLPTSYRRLLSGGGFGNVLTTTRFDRQITESTRAVPAFIPLLREVSDDRNGVLFVTPNAGTPMYLDPLGDTPHNHQIITGYMGSGKTTIMAGMAEYAYQKGYQVLIFDADKGDSAGALEPFTEFVGGAYFKPSQQSSNLFEGADWRTVPAHRLQDAQSTFRQFLKNALRDLSLPSDSDTDVVADAKNIYTLLLDSFFLSQEINDRYQSAFDYGIGSEAWDNIPTLITFIEWMTLDNLPGEMRTHEMKVLMDRMIGALIAVTKRQSGRAIAQPSTFRSDSNFLVYSLGVGADNAEALPLLLSAQSSMLSRSISAEKTFIPQDEASQFFSQFESIADINLRWYRTGRSLDVWVTLLGQDLIPFEESPSGRAILDLNPTYITGYIQERAIELLTKQGIPRHLLYQNANPDSFLMGRGQARRFLISKSGRHFYGDFRPSFVMHGLTMNKNDEKAIREKYRRQYSDKFQYCSELAKFLENKYSVR